MEYTTLGKTGLQVSRICLGCMSYAAGPAGQPWVLSGDEGRRHIGRALDQGINFFDTANVYSTGGSEEVVGAALRELARREAVVIATKVHGVMRDEPNGRGLSRKAIMNEIDASLRRLQTDYVDLYQIHRWDPVTPLEETLSALHDVVKAGKARYIGASSMFAWQFCKALYLSRQHGWTSFVSMQNHYNLVYREEEREMLALCAAEGIGVLPWSPLARGRLARTPEQSTATHRGETDQFARRLYDATTAADEKVIEAVGKVAAERGVPRAQVALAWLLHQPTVTAPIVGVTKDGQLDDAVAAVKLKLSSAELDRLAAPYVPHAVAGHQ